MHSTLQTGVLTVLSEPPNVRASFIVPMRKLGSKAKAARSSSLPQSKRKEPKVLPSEEWHFESLGDDDVPTCWLWEYWREACGRDPEVRPGERIPDFADKLIREEGAGILSWIVEGAMKYLREIAEFGDIRLTPKQSHRVQRLLQESDSLREFIRSRIERAPLDVLTVKELQEAYRDFCDEMGWKSFTGNNLRGTANDLMTQIHKVSLRHDIPCGATNVRGFKGVRVIEGGVL